MSHRKKILIMKSSKVDMRLQVLLFLFTAVFAVLVFRLWTIQIYMQDDFIKLAERNYYRLIPIPSKRGTIKDRNGNILAMDVNYYDVWIPIHAKNGKRFVSEDIKTTLNLLSHILEVPYEDLEGLYRRNKRDSYYKQNRVCVAKRIDKHKYAAIVTRQIEFPKEAMVFTEKVPTRWYGYGSMAAHVLGITGEISPEELNLARYAGYSQGDRIGLRGIEWAYEKYLRGQDGLNRVTVNNHEIQQGRPIEVKPAVPGNDVILNLDINLQQAAELVLGASKGVVIVADPRDNSILAMASSPRFDSNNYSRDFRKYYNDRSAPLTDRAIAGKYPPGSVIKVFEVFPLMEDLRFTPGHTEYCPGSFSLPGNTWRCHERNGHGYVNMLDAVRLSCDVFFYKTIDQLGIERLFTWMATFGLNQKTGIDLRNELYTPYPNPGQKMATKREPWYRGDTINTSIGQGDVSLTPIQISTGICAIANRGTLYQPRVAQKVIDPDNNEVEVFSPQVTGKIEAATKTWDAAHKAMWEVVNGVSGTGRRVKNEKFVLAGKTGTSETGVKGKGKEPHAWFVCYGPYEHPEIVITILLENGGHGGEHASPLAKKILDVYLGNVSLQNLV
ncbi:MAG: penicillin-binding protein 2 [Candidatus Omnitrophota bacterium]|jgi:penicillin-binding protein 2|nr:MAG: penicillin-binding protein 2 [Candidatus Omnitrophota bacterium]